MSTRRRTDHSRVMGKKRTGPKPDSERDSGFSDASSEHQSNVDQTDPEDPHRPSRTPQLAVVGGSYASSPMIIMKNVLLKQPGDDPPPLKPLGFSSSVEVMQQPQVVFLQPVGSHRAPAKRRRPKKYLPILKTYPKIAPHPGGTSSGSNSSFISTEKKSSSSASGQRERHHRDKQQRHLSGSSGSSDRATSRFPPGSTLHQSKQTDSSACSSPGADTAAQDFTPFQNPQDTISGGDSVADDSCYQGDGYSSDGPSESHSKRKRFCNTYNVLSKSGLLDITLRTKELIRHNRRSQGQLERLRLQTELLLEAVRTGDAGALARLQASVQEEERERVGRSRAEEEWSQSEGAETVLRGALAC